MLGFCLSVSMHIALGSGWNQVHPCVSYVADDFTVGAFLNSESNVSLYAAHDFGNGPWMLEVGVVTGYSGGDLLPFVRGGYEIKDNVTLFAAPGLVDGKLGLVLGIEVKFN